jgi:hypothetical protein
MVRPSMMNIHVFNSARVFRRVYNGKIFVTIVSTTIWLAEALAVDALIDWIDFR